MALALLLLAVMTTFAAPTLDLWTLMVLGIVALLLELSGTRSDRGQVAGSLVFVVHLSAGLLLGPFYAALIAAASKLISQLSARTGAAKVVFNVAERAVTVGLAFTVYHLAGGAAPPEFLLPGSAGVDLATATLIFQLGVFFAAVVVYFAVNSIAVNWVIALSSKQPFLSTWRKNSAWAFGYDFAASVIALLVVAVYLRAQAGAGIERLGFLVVILGLILVRHIYGKLNTVQDLYNELDAAYAQLETNVREQLELMVKAIEARDPYTSGHSRRVSGLSWAIASDMGLDEEHVGQIVNAALMHDIGKIHEEFAPILQKEGKLTDEEWALMKTHSVKSAELVSLFSRFKGYVVSCVRHHHERWDGNGYPDGIAGETIPLGARIITIADTIDAMTTDRPYRDALSLEEVLAELNRCRGTQFDADLVELAVNSVTVRRLIVDPDSVTMTTAQKAYNRRKLANTPESPAPRVARS